MTLIWFYDSNKKDAGFQDPRSRNRGSPIYHHDPHGDVICPVPATLGSAGLEVLIAEGVYTCLGSHQVRHWTIICRMLPKHFGLTEQGEEPLHLQGQMTLISRKMQICFYIIMVGKNSGVMGECVPPKFVFWSPNLQCSYIWRWVLWRRLKEVVRMGVWFHRISVHVRKDIGALSLSLCTCTEKRPCEHTTRRWLSTT